MKGKRADFIFFEKSIRLEFMVHPQVDASIAYTLGYILLWSFKTQILFNDNMLYRNFKIHP